MNCSILISFVALIFSILVYFKYDKKIKFLEKEKLEREELENKRARIDMQYKWVFDHHILRLQNNGKSTAKNIAISIESKEALTFQDGTTQYRISQLEVTERTEPIQLNGGYQYAIKVKLTWDDESGKGVTQTASVEDESGHEFISK